MCRSLVWTSSSVFALQATSLWQLGVKPVLYLCEWCFLTGSHIDVYIYMYIIMCIYIYMIIINYNMYLFCACWVDKDLLCLIV